MEATIIHFAQTYPAFRLPELYSVIHTFKLNVTFNENEYDLEVCVVYLQSPFLKAEMDQQAIDKILERCVLVKSIYRFWTEANTLEMLLEEMQKLPNSHYDLYRDLRFAFMPLEGMVDLKNAQVTFVLIYDYGAAHSKDKSRLPVKYYFGTLCGYSNRSFIDLLDLKKREYIGTTSMDAELALVMANLGGCKEGSLVYDPFVGTGGCLLPMMVYGSIGIGSDIDGRQIRGTTKGRIKRTDRTKLNESKCAPDCVKSSESKCAPDCVKSNESRCTDEEDSKSDSSNVFANLEQYNLMGKLLDLAVFDVTQHPWRLESWLDAIVTDPPYGVRAGARRIGKHGFNGLAAEEELPDTKIYAKTDCYPQTVVYPTSCVISDLLQFAAIHLKQHGRLVYWLPHLPEEDLSEFSHPSLITLHKCEQNFGSWSRTLITMEKVVEGKEKGPCIRNQHHFRHSYFRN